MKLQQLTLANFRLTEHASYVFGANLTAITGANGKGKTNLIDAIHYLCLARSYFHAQDERLLRFGAPYLSVEGQFDRSGQKFKVHGAWRPGEKGFRCDGKVYDRLSDHVGRFPTVMIAPVDLNLIHEGGEQRRRLMDLTLSQEDPNYLVDLSRFNRLLRQKQVVLREWQATGKGDEHLLRVLTEQMNPLNFSISQRRKKWVGDMAALLVNHYQHISGGREVPSLEYKSGCPFVLETGPDAPGEGSAAVQENSYSVGSISYGTEEHGAAPGKSVSIVSADSIDLPNSEQWLKQEKNSGRCLWGIHRDDLLFLLEGHPLKPHASQGQQKTYVISLKLAQSELIRKATGTQPILLLDDIFEKLDEQRVSALLERVSVEPDRQVFLTHTEEDRVRAFFGSKTDVEYIGM
ncbi:MAG: DNA replication and repair protein RecF [Bacteroidetes bacterium]|nr:DNA replication and repair protein RecF [Bacteroidota bacterium]